MNFFKNPEYNSIKAILLLILIAGISYFIFSQISKRLINPAGIISNGAVPVATVTTNTATIGNLAPGTYTFSVTATDGSGNTSDESTPVTVTITGGGTSDTTPPVISSILATPTSTSAMITWNTDELATSRVEYGTTSAYGNQTTESDSTSGVTNHSITITGLTPNTQYHYRVKSKDRSVNSNFAQSTDQTFTTLSVTNQSATLTVTTVVINDNGGTNTVSDFPLSVSGTTVVSGIAHTFAPGTYTVSETTSPNYSVTYGGSCSSVGSITLLAGDTKTCTVTNNDIAQAPSTPTITSSVPISGNNNNPKLIGTTDTGTTVSIYTVSTCTGTPTATGTAANFMGTGISVSVADNTTTNFYASATKNGLTSGCSPVYRYIEVTPDTTPPVISTVAAAANETGATITWTTDEISSSQVEYGATISYGSSSTKIDTNPRVITHTVTLSGLSSGTLYHYRVKSEDGALNLATGADHSFTTTTIPPPSTPVITGSSPPSGGNTNTPKLMGTTNAGTTVSLFTNSSCTGTAVATGSATTFTTGGIAVSVADNSTTSFYAHATLNGLTSSCSAPFVYQEVTVDTTAPTLSSITSSPSTTSATITWTTNENASTQVDYGTSTSYGSSTAETDTVIKVRNHSVTLTGLSTHTTYHYRVKSKDGAGNLATSGDRQFTTLSIVVIPPTFTGSIPASGGNDNAPKLVGTAPSGSTVKIYTSATCTGTLIASGLASIFTSTGITVAVPDNSSTTFFGTATDGSGNVSACSTGGFTYQEISSGGGGTDTTAPVISSIGAYPGPNSADISWVTNEPASTIVEYGTTTSYGSSFLETNTSPRVLSHFVSLSGLASNTTYHYRVKSKDEALNLATSDDQTFITQTQSSSGGGGGSITGGGSYVPPTYTPPIISSPTACPIYGSPSLLIKLGSRGTSAQGVQYAVNQMKIINPLLVTDGIIGPKSLIGIQAAQLALGTKVDGLWGKITQGLYVLWTQQKCPSM